MTHESEDKRIDALEAQLRALSEELQHLKEGRDDDAEELTPDVEPIKKHELLAEKTLREKEADLVQNVREKMDKVFPGDPEEAIETRIGAVWLSRVAVVILMTAVVLGGRLTVNAENIGPWVVGPSEKVLIGYLLAGAFIAYGVFFRKLDELFSAAILGCGLAALYYTTYAMFNVEQVKLFTATRWSMVPLLGCLVLLGGFAHWAKSQTVAAVGIFLAYYTVVLSVLQEPTLDSLIYALTISTALVVLTLLFHISHRWLLFSWAMLITTHVTYLYFFLYQPTSVKLSGELYFWVSNGFLTINYILFALLSIADARKTGEYRKGVAPMAGTNSFIFFVLTYFSISHTYPEEQWIFRLIIAGVMLLFAILCTTTGPSRNYLYQIYIAKVVVLLTLALEAYFSEEKVLVAMAIECLGLGFSYRRSGLVIFKVLGIGLMGITVIGCLLAFFSWASALDAVGMVELGPYTVPAVWFTAVGVSLSFCIVAWFYEKFVKRLRPQDRTVKGQWFMADTPLDLHNASLSIIHAAAAAIVLLTLTIIELSNHPLLPFILTLEGVVMAVIGLALRTPQIDVASVLLLVAAHVCYHIFLFPIVQVEGFTTQENFVIYTLILAGFTFIGAMAWERYLNRVPKGESELEHDIVAAVPYLMATFILTTLVSRQLAVVQIPTIQTAIGAGLLLVGCLFHLSAIKASGILALGQGAVTFFLYLMNTDNPMAKLPDYIPWFIGFLITFVIAERLFVVLQHYEKVPSRMEDHLRSVIIATAVVLGVLGLYVYTSNAQLILNYLLLSTVAIILGFVFRESRYRWAALGLFAMLTLQAFLQFDEMSDLAQFLTFGAAALVLLSVSWGYSIRRRKRRMQKQSHEEAAPPAS